MSEQTLPLPQISALDPQTRMDMQDLLGQ